MAHGDPRQPRRCRDERVVLHAREGAVALLGSGEVREEPSTSIDGSARRLLGEGDELIERQAVAVQPALQLDVDAAA